MGERAKDLEAQTLEVEALNKYVTSLHFTSAGDTSKIDRLVRAAIESLQAKTKLQAERIDFQSFKIKLQSDRLVELKEENATLSATARAYVEAHKLMRVRFNDAEDAAAYTEAGKKLEELIDA